MGSIIIKESKESVDLPVDLIVEILLRLPVKSLLRFTCVSKSWLSLIKTQKFINLHLNHQFSKSPSCSRNIILFGQDSIHISDIRHPNRQVDTLSYPENVLFSGVVGSYNGLVCFKSVSVYTIYNYATRACKTLPKPIERKKRVNKGVARVDTFNYDCISDDYKILSFIQYLDENWRPNKDVETQLYSMKANEWEIIQNPPWELVVSSNRPSLVVDNALHWIEVVEQQQPKRSAAKIQEVVRSFDLSTRSYDEMPFPEGITLLSSILAVIEGRLHLISNPLNIWMLNKDDGTDKFWSRLLISPSVNPIRSYFDVILCPMPICWPIQERSAMSKAVKISCYDLESKAVTKVEIKGLPYTGFYVTSWVESLVPLE